VGRSIPNTEPGGKLPDELFFCSSPPEQLNFDEGQQFDSTVIA